MWAARTRLSWHVGIGFPDGAPRGVEPTVAGGRPCRPVETDDEARGGHGESPPTIADPHLQRRDVGIVDPPEQLGRLRAALPRDPHAGRVAGDGRCVRDPDGVAQPCQLPLRAGWPVRPEPVARDHQVEVHPVAHPQDSARLPVPDFIGQQIVAP
jgi:hypothetical protein